MNTSGSGAFDDLSVDHVGIYLTASSAHVEHLTSGFGFEVTGDARTPAGDHTTVLQLGDLVLRLTEDGTGRGPAAGFLQVHGDGVHDVALRTVDARAAFAEAVARGARPVQEPREAGGVITATIAAFADLTHTFAQYTDPAAGPRADPDDGGLLRQFDHFALCVESGQLVPAAEFYEQVLDFTTVFEERTAVGGQAMNSVVVQSRSGGVTLVLIEPDTSAEPGQIDEFLRRNEGPGVQHIAFSTEDVVRTVGTLADRGVGFLATPDVYYDLLSGRLELVRHSVGELRDLSILVDRDHDGQLFQIFTRSVHPRRTLFFEVIERAGARTFGSGNVKALYEAMEAARGALSEAAK